MRSELEQFEMIDQYLAGQMSADQAAAFEAQMNADPALKSMVQDQQLLIQTVSRNAILAEINSVAGLAGAAGASAGWGLVQWVITSLSVIGATALGIVIYFNVQDDNATDLPENTANEIIVADNELVEEPAHDTIAFQEFEIGVEESTESLSDETGSDATDHYGHNHAQDFILSPNKVNYPSDNHISQTDNKNETKSVESDEKVVVVENLSDGVSTIERNRKAEFDGGYVALRDWLSKNLLYPGTPKEEKLQASVKVNFLVNPDGGLSHINVDCHILKDEFGKPLTSTFQRMKYNKSIKAFERQVLHAFRKTPRWIPATNSSGTAVVSEQVWIVNFKLKGYKAEIFPLTDDSGWTDEEGQDEKQELDNLYIKKSKPKRDSETTFVVRDSL